MVKWSDFEYVLKAGLLGVYKKDWINVTRERLSRDD